MNTSWSFGSGTRWRRRSAPDHASCVAGIQLDAPDRNQCCVSAAGISLCVLFPSQTKGCAQTAFYFDRDSGVLYHWSAMEFGEHWLQRLSLVLARGQGDLVLEAVKTARKNHRGRDGGRGASAEWSQTDCQPCVSLV